MVACLDKEFVILSAKKIISPNSQSLTRINKNSSKHKLIIFLIRHSKIEMDMLLQLETIY